MVTGIYGAIYMVTIITMIINQNVWIKYLSVNRKDLTAFTLVGLNWENPVLDPLAVHTTTTDYK